MRRSILIPCALAIAGVAGAPPPAEAKRSLGAIKSKIESIEGQLSHYLTTIKPPQRSLTRKQRIKRLIDGMVLYRMKDFSRAAIVLMDLADRYPGTPEGIEAMFFLADSMFMQREFVLARRYFGKVVQHGVRGRYYQMALQRLLELEMRKAHLLGKANRADSAHLRQVEGLLRRIQAIPASRREPSVEYVRGKYLYFRGRVTDALSVFGGLGPSHPYYLQGVYFIGVCHINKGRLNAAAAVYKRLIDKVLFGAFRPKTAKQRQVLQLLIMAAARVAYYKGDSKNILRAIELYNAIPRKSAYFDHALYERAWAYLKAQLFQRAVKTLELLQIANPKYGRGDEARVLLGNLKIQTKDFAGAKEVFRKAAKQLRPVFRKLQGLGRTKLDPKVIFAQLTARNMEQFDIKIRLPELALRWLRKQPQVKRALMMLDDLGAIKQMIAESRELVRAIERRLASGNLITAYPSLTLARARAADLETQILGLRAELSSHLQRVLGPAASADERQRLASLGAQRKQLSALLNKAPQSTEAYKTRVGKIRRLFEKVASDTLVQQIRIRDLSRALRAIKSYYYRTLADQRLPKEVLERNAKALQAKITSLQAMLKRLRRDVADAKGNVGIGDAVMQYEQQLRKKYRSVLAAERQLAGAIAGRLSGSALGAKSKIDVLLRRLDKAQGNLDRVNKRIKTFLAQKRAEVVRVLGEEKVKIQGYRKHVARYEPQSKVVVGGVTVRNFRRVSQKVYNVLVKADVGVLDVVWAIKNLAKGGYEKRESLYLKALQRLKQKYREPRGQR